MNPYFTDPLSGLNDFHLLQEQLADSSGRSAFQITGAADSGETHLAASLGSNIKYKIIITFHDIRAREIYDDMKSFDANTFYYPAKDFIFFSADAYGNLIIRQRLDAISQLVNGQPFTLITTIDGLMDKLVPLKCIQEGILKIEYDEQIDINELKNSLVYSGFERTEQVESPGQFAIRGGIIDIFPLTSDQPYRIELWDDIIDSIRSFDPLSQRTIENVNEITIYPASEYLLSSHQIEKGIKEIKLELDARIKVLKDTFKTEEAHRLSSTVNEFTERLSISRTGVFLDSFMPYFYQETSSLLDYFPVEDTILFIDEPSRTLERADTVEQEFRESMASRIEGGYVMAGQTEVFLSTALILAKL